MQPETTYDGSEFAILEGLFYLRVFFSPNSHVSKELSPMPERLEDITLLEQMER